jgi:hypothetical protein
MRMSRLHLLILSTVLVSSTAEASRWGLESDLFAWASGGYHASAWFGTERIRVRAIRAVFYSPAFTVPDGFDRLRNAAWEFFVDVAWRPSGKRFEGFWSGAGLELYYRRVRSSSSGDEEDFEALEPALRAGYIWRPFDAGFYVNPWVGVNVRVDGEGSVPFDDRTYSAPRVVPLASLKLGWQF